MTTAPLLNRGNGSAAQYGERNYTVAGVAGSMVDALFADLTNYTGPFADPYYYNDTGSWNLTGGPGGGGGNWTRDSASLQTDGPGGVSTWKVHHRASSYAFIITMLSITVVMATMFTLFGLFMKAEAHKSSEDHHGATSTGGGGRDAGHSMFPIDITGNDDNFMKSIDMDMDC